MAKLETFEGEGMHSEVLLGRTQQRFFDVSSGGEDRFTYPWAYEVDFNKRAEFDAAKMDYARDQPEDPRANEPG